MLRPRTLDLNAALILNPQECADRFAPLIWSLVSRLTETESEAQQIVSEVRQDLLRRAEEFIFPLAIDAAIVATITRRHLDQRAAVLRPLDPSALVRSAYAPGSEHSHQGPEPLSLAQQAVLGLGGSLPSRVRNAPSDRRQPARSRPGLMKLRAALAQAMPLEANCATEP